MNIDKYIDLARDKNNLRSDRQLSFAFGLNAAAVNTWRTRRAWPSDDVMIKLAKMAGVDPMDAILDLNIWRSSGEAITLYTRIKKSMTAMLVLLAVGVGGQLATPSNALAAGLESVHSIVARIDIMENYVNYLWTGLKGIFTNSISIYAGKYQPSNKAMLA